eukprot:scaffold1311_cov256-Pinguiococcus_pyrenoidosus.AAC.33
MVDVLLFRRAVPRFSTSTVVLRNAVILCSTRLNMPPAFSSELSKCLAACAPRASRSESSLVYAQLNSVFSTSAAAETSPTGSRSASNRWTLKLRRGSHFTSSKATPAWDISSERSPRVDLTTKARCAGLSVLTSTSLSKRNTACMRTSSFKSRSLSKSGASVSGDRATEATAFTRTSFEVSELIRRINSLVILRTPPEPSSSCSSAAVFAAAARTFGARSLRRRRSTSSILSTKSASSSTSSICASASAKKRHARARTPLSSASHRRHVCARIAPAASKSTPASESARGISATNNSPRFTADSYFGWRNKRSSPPVTASKSASNECISFGSEFSESVAV